MTKPGTLGSGAESSGSLGGIGSGATWVEDPAMPASWRETFAAGTGAQGLFLADLLSAFFARERTALLLEQSAAASVRDELWRQKYEELARRSEGRVRALGELIDRLGGDPLYVSPAARLVEMEGAKRVETILQGEAMADSLTVDLAVLEAVLIAGNRSRESWRMLRKIAEQLPESTVTEALRAALSAVHPADDEDLLRWAETTWEHTVLSRVKLAAPSGVEPAA